MMHSEELIIECAKAISEYCDQMMKKTNYSCEGCCFKTEDGCRIAGFHKSTKMHKDNFGIEMEIVTKAPADWYRDYDDKNKMGGNNDKERV